MINLGLHIRHAQTEDYRQISDLLFREVNSHRHLDWRTALDWVGSHNFWVMEDGKTIQAAFACPEDPPNMAWIRIFAHDSRINAREVWSGLWAVAEAEIGILNRQAHISAIVMKQWFQSLLLESGFEEIQQVVLLHLDRYDFRPARLPGGINLRPMRADDLENVAVLDLASFGPFWHNTAESLDYAMSNAAYSSVAEDASGLIGYQISTGNPAGAHLARLAVRPEAQGRGIGPALITDVFQKLRPGRLSVNTQSDNSASLRLYKKMGFIRTGEFFPVLTYQPRTW